MDTPDLATVKRNLRDSSIQRQVGFNMVVTEYLLECIVKRLCATPDLYTNLTFKGGYVCARIYESPRYTTDVDVSVRNISSQSVVDKAKKAIDGLSKEDVAWFECQKVTDLLTQGEYPGSRIVARGSLGVPKSPQRCQLFHLDVGIDDCIFPSPVTVETKSISGLGSFNWKVYPIELVVAEKLQTMISRGSDNSRSRDVFDLNLLLDRCDIETLRASFSKTCSHRGTPVPDSLSSTIEQLDVSLLKRGWTGVVSSLSPTDTFDDTFASLLAKLKKAGL